MQPGFSTYTTSILDGLHHWAGQGDYADRRSKEGFTTQAECIADAQFRLTGTERPAQGVILTVSRDSDDPRDLDALSIPEEKRRCIIDKTEVENFIADCYFWDAERLAEGYSLCVHISREHWDAWLEGLEVVDDGELPELPESSGYVQIIAIAAEGNAIQAKAEGRKVRVPQSEGMNFIQDCPIWAAERFEAGEPIATAMKPEHWAAWLEQFEAA